MMNKICAELTRVHTRYPLLIPVFILVLILKVFILLDLLSNTI